MSGTEYALEARGIIKVFGNHVALDNVNFGLKAGEVHALLGENGAGKSTLIKILTGAYQPTTGQVLADGEPVVLDNPQQAQKYGIGTVYQEVNLLPNRSVAENLYLGHQPTRFGFVNRRKMEADTRTVLARYGLDLDPASELGSHSVAVQQIVAIARAVELSGKVLILDEPTASLDRNEVERLFEIIAGLKSSGLAIVFITHFLDQVFAIADRVTILRNGKLIETRALDDLSRTDVVRLMLGKDVAFSGATKLEENRPLGDVLLDFQNYGRKRSVLPFNLTIHKGEVIGVAGLLGSGRTEMARIMFGADSADEGTVSFEGKPASIARPTDAIALGFGFCPEDRKAEGIFGDLSVRENIIIALQGKLGWFSALNRDEQMEIAGKFGESMDIRAASLDMPIKLLSGGNQQKVILSRWLATDPSFLILDEPTRGIDVGAHAEIVRTINRLRDEGLALVVISSELDEVVAYSSRIVVMRDREMVAELNGENINPGVIVQAIANHREGAPA
ncbi:sugar ABC transporter ATP-binding protein [Devosia sp. 63-57]|uniref:sugar ABC transporter ATP-binding protein n=1 Tax=Devosia sp. 63-57 TaxID=1895751 RepID=UPI00086DA928|nr:sugar ABC transporter ATP-binding protein [Devosia sp. 63-57]ODT50940.1 MAG: sugar ABC transporter ATP-binding protein [Pelagibacterium sp. SCN 63-126]ODU85671.1 MAG: sugar ABC transporter ATP-binding protein [Pelagibacterium sp. SCN 63-17]OJX44400.1 MAG: sugar ABC transporter ATP-binding protein [Devosia sp. 63-57]